MNEIATSKTVIPPQPGSPRQAHQLLPLSRLALYLAAGTLFCILGTFGFLWLATAIFSDRLRTFDDAILNWAHGYWGPTIDQVMLFFTTMGSPQVLFFLTGAAALALLWRRRWIDAIGLISASGGAGLLNQALKLIYQRVRPSLFNGPFHLSSYSFPSGHSMGAIACYGMMAYIGARLMRRRSHRSALFIGAALLTAAIGFSRIYFGVHYPTDVLGGFTAGASWLVFVISALQTAEWYAQRRAAHLPEA